MQADVIPIDINKHIAFRYLSITPFMINRCISIPISNKCLKDLCALISSSHYSFGLILSERRRQSSCMSVYPLLQSPGLSPIQLSLSLSQQRLQSGVPPLPPAAVDPPAEVQQSGAPSLIQRCILLPHPLRPASHAFKGAHLYQPRALSPIGVRALSLLQLLR